MLLGPVRTPWFMLLQGGLENLESMYGVSFQCPLSIPIESEMTNMTRHLFHRIFHCLQGKSVCACMLHNEYNLEAGVQTRYGIAFTHHIYFLMCRYKQMMQTLKNTMMVVVESLINKFEEDQLRKEEMHRESQHQQSNSHYTDNCSDSDSSFNQVIACKINSLQVTFDALIEFGLQLCGLLLSIAI